MGARRIQVSAGRGGGVVALTAGVWLALFGFYLRCVPGTFYFEDSPELIAAAATLGNTHPPGYPFLALAGKLAQVAPVGTLALRFNLLIAACAAAAAICLGLITRRLCTAVWANDPGGGKNLALGAGLLAGGVWAFSDAFWWEAVIGDKYAPFYLLFMLSVAASVEALSCPVSRLGRACAFSCAATGLALAYHHYGAFALPLTAAVFWRTAREIRVPRARILGVAVFLGMVPIAAEAVFPPIRSEAGAELDWGMPRTFSRLVPYLEGRLYHQSLDLSSLASTSGLLRDRMSLAVRLIREEIPPILLVGVPAGAAVLVRLSWPLAAGMGACAFANACYAATFTEKIVRWYEPAYGLLLSFSALGFVLAARMAGRNGATVLLLAALGATSWQAARGLSRNELSSFTAAHDFGRNLLRSCPADAIYLGAGDFDLFPLWGLRYGSREREDVDSIGLASFVDPYLAGAGNHARLLSRLGVEGEATAALVYLLGKPSGRPVMLAPVGYDLRLYASMPFLTVSLNRGIAGRFTRHWDPMRSYRLTRRFARTYTYRGLIYARTGGLFDMVRVRDEVTRSALLHYPLCFSILGRQCLKFGLNREAAWAYGQARRQMEALVGALPSLQASRSNLESARASRLAVALGCQRLADIFAERGVAGLATSFRENALAISQ